MLGPVSKNESNKFCIFTLLGITKNQTESPNGMENKTSSSPNFWVPCLSRNLVVGVNLFDLAHDFTLRLFFLVPLSSWRACWLNVDKIVGQKVTWFRVWPQCGEVGQTGNFWVRVVWMNYHKNVSVHHDSLHIMLFCLKVLAKSNTCDDLSSYFSMNTARTWQHTININLFSG